MISMTMAEEIGACSMHTTTQTRFGLRPSPGRRPSPDYRLFPGQHPCPGRCPFPGCPLCLRLLHHHFPFDCLHYYPCRGRGRYLHLFRGHYPRLFRGRFCPLLARRPFRDHLRLSRRRCSHRLLFGNRQCRPRLVLHHVSTLAFPFFATLSVIVILSPLAIVVALSVAALSAVFSVAEAAVAFAPAPIRANYIRITFGPTNPPVNAVSSFCAHRSGAAGWASDRRSWRRPRVRILMLQIDSDQYIIPRLVDWECRSGINSTLPCGRTGRPARGQQTKAKRECRVQ
ncbi:hypothetical protein B0H11DRAFT_830635 [Mycena galericulata]|nr:hypothetical protein B0H11DRAFT_830635 [Mycena galericulata]